MIDMLISIIILCAGFWLAVVGITGVFGNSFKAAGICLVQFWLALTGITAAALRGAGLGRLVDQRKPLFLPPWTGRERESLQRDLELASVSFRSPVKTYRVEWYEDKRGHPKSSPVRLPYVPKQPPLEEVADTHGLFPEALDAYLESQE